MTRATRLLPGLLGFAGAFALAAVPATALKTFRSPSDNIHCAISKRGVRCDIEQRTWDPPPAPRSCEFHYGIGLTIGKRGRAEFVCANDTVLGAGRRLLAYGERIRRGRFVCKSREAGMRCVNKRNRHGFKLSRERTKRF